MGNQVVGATIAQRPQPQTTRNMGPGPFVQHAQQAARPGYVHAGVPLGGVLTDPLPQVPGYARRLDLNLLSTGGATGGGLNADTTLAGMANFVQFLQLKDPMGTPVLVGSGFDMLYLVPLFGGQFGLFKASDVTTFPTYVVPTAVGNGNSDLTIPLEGALGYGLLAMGNASALPTLQINIAPSGSIFSAAPTTLPTVQVTCDIPYYAVSDPSIEPEGLGTTYQWLSVPASPTIGNGASQRVQLPRTAGYLHTLILEMRDSTGARIDGFGTRIRLYIDGVPIFDETLNERINEMYRQAGGQITRPTGVLCYSWRESISQVNLGLADTNLRSLPVTPGTLIEIECTPWGTVTNAPAVLTAIFGTIVPRGGLVTGLPQEMGG